MKLIKGLALAVGTVVATPSAGGHGGPEHAWPSGSWKAATTLRGVRPAIRIVESEGGTRGIFCALRQDTTVIAVPFGSGEAIPVAQTREGELAIDAIGARFSFRNEGETITHTVTRNGKQRPGTHVLTPSKTEECALPEMSGITARVADPSKPIQGTWRGVSPKPEGPAIEIVIGRIDRPWPEGAICERNGNGSIVFAWLGGVRAVPHNRTGVQWKRHAAPAALPHNSHYIVNPDDKDIDRATLTIQTSRKIERIALHRGLADHGCMQMLQSKSKPMTQTTH